LSSRRVRSRFLGFVVAMAALLIAADPAPAATPLAVEFQVNTHTSSSQYLPDIAMAANGAFVVVWEHYDYDSSRREIIAQRFDSSGGAVGGELVVSSFTFGNRYPRVAADAEGDFVVVWSSTSRFVSADALVEVYGRRFDSTGVATEPEFRVNTHTLDLQFQAAVAVDADGDFVVTWIGIGQDGDPGPGINGAPGIVAQRFASSGARLGGEFLVNSYTPGFQFDPAIAVEDDGDFVITWDSESDADSSYGVRAQRFASSGARHGVEFAVNAYTTGSQSYSAIGMDDDGDFVVVWTSVGQPGTSGTGVFGRRYDSSGAAIGGELQVSGTQQGADYIEGLPVPRAVARDADGDFVVVWSNSEDYAYAGARVRARLFDPDGNPKAVAFTVNLHEVGDQQRAAAAMGPDGDFVVVWQSVYAGVLRDDQDGFGHGLFGRRFAAPTPGGVVLDVDANGAVDPLTDGLLILRRLFGFSGAALVDGAIGAGCTRCDAGDVATYIDGLGLVLDVDDNDDVDALTDGLMILRRRFGFSDNALVTGALGPGCARCGAGDIAAYIDGLSM
jgi:hypothetical protein